MQIRIHGFAEDGSEENQIYSPHLRNVLGKNQIELSFNMEDTFDIVMRFMNEAEEFRFKDGLMDNRKILAKEFRDRSQAKLNKFGSGARLWVRLGPVEQ